MGERGHKNKDWPEDTTSVHLLYTVCCGNRKMGALNEVNEELKKWVVYSRLLLRKLAAGISKKTIIFGATEKHVQN